MICAARLNDSFVEAAAPAENVQVRLRLPIQDTKNRAPLNSTLDPFMDQAMWEPTKTE
jgi:phage tail tape-measure protein